MLGKPLRKSRTHRILVRVFVSCHNTKPRSLSASKSTQGASTCKSIRALRRNRMITLATCDVLLRHFRKMLFTVGIRGFILLSIIYTVLLLVLSNVSGISYPAGFGHCLLPIHATKVFISCTLQLHVPLDIFYKDVLQLMSEIATVVALFLVIIHLRSRSNPPTRGGLARSRCSRHKSTYAKMLCGQDWTRSNCDSITIEALVQTGLMFYLSFRYFHLFHPWRQIYSCISTLGLSRFSLWFTEFNSHVGSDCAIRVIVH